MNKTLLIELRTEELPPKALNSLGNGLAEFVVEGLCKARLIDGDVRYTAYASPRRLAVLVSHVRTKQEDQEVVRKGPSIQAALKEGEPTKALHGFARSCGVDIDNLIQINDGKNQVFAYAYTENGQILSALLSDILVQAIKKLPIPKVMRWGSSEHTFVRPVHGLVMMHGDTLVSGSVLGLESQNWTLGHRFMSSEPIVFKQADDYEKQMEKEGKVLASFSARRAHIIEGLQGLSGSLNATLASDDALLDEVSALVEWPVVLEAGFEAHFLQVPQECLILTMQQNQKYFPLLNQNGKLINRFLLVSNIEADDFSHIIQGNERVLRARLADAEFFYYQDRKSTLESRLPKLSQVVYHNKLGSQSERLVRLCSLSKTIANALGADERKTQRAMQLSKADLLTEMVGEFPELQGTMGKYYALHDGEDTEVAEAIEAHYRPRFAGDKLPEGKVATAVALADKLETLVGIWGIGLIPTGDKDPYALRRSALGILRMLMENHLQAKPLLQAAFNTFTPNLLSDNTVFEVSKFMQARLAILLQNDYEHDVVAAVLAHPAQNLGEIPAKLAAVSTFKRLPEAAALAAANKRVHNLLKKAEVPTADVRSDLLQEDAEKVLFIATEQLAETIHNALANVNFQAALSALAGIKPSVDAFFDQVMVMADNVQIKENRLNLLNYLSSQLNAVADIALLSE